MKRVIDPLTQMGARIRSRQGNGMAPLEIDGGGLHGIQYRMPIASAQVKSAIVLAALQAEGKTVIQEPQRSRDHTEVMLGGFGGMRDQMGNVSAPGWAASGLPVSNDNGEGVSYDSLKLKMEN